MEQQLGTLKLLDIRTVFPGEASDFTPWLAERGLSMLSNVIGMELEYIDREVTVGSFRADIHAHDVYGHSVVIENQFDKTNHDHLGKMLTYVAGLDDVKTAIWITETVREEHRAVIDWMNNHTDADVNFFLIQIKVVQIGDSLPAPVFQIESKPNQWIKTSKKGTDMAMSRFMFFETLKLKYPDKNVSWSRSRIDKNYLNIMLGKSGVLLSIDVKKGSKNIENYVQISYYIAEDRNLFDYIKTEYKQKIEQELGSVEWYRPENKKATRILKNIQLDWLNNNVEQNTDILIEQLHPFYKIFQTITNLIPSVY